MKINIKYNLFGLILFLFAFASCDVETAEQDAMDIISPNDKPTLVVTSDATGNSLKGSTVTYTLTLDQTIDRDILFTPSVTGGTADDHAYLPLEPVTLAGYTKSVDFQVVLVQDYLIEDEKTLQIQLEITGIGQKYLLHPDTVIPPMDIVIESIEDPTLLIVNFEWDNDLDMDMLTYSDTPTFPAELWGTGGATGANPEVDTSIWLADPLGDYYICILDWGEGVDFNYTYKLLHPDGSIQEITGSFDATNYPYDFFVGPDAWGNPNAYKILKVVNDGAKFVVTAL